jgi:phosphomannomutase/phosphoglucomutase
MSGHIFFNDKWYGFDDGHYAAARATEILSNHDKNISDIIRKFPTSSSTPELNITVTDETKFTIVKKFTNECSLDGKKITIDGLRINFDNGWGLIRASNTSPKLVMRFEGNSLNDMNEIKDLFLSELTRICPDIVINLD